MIGDRFLRANPKAQEIVDILRSSGPMSSEDLRDLTPHITTSERKSLMRRLKESGLVHKTTDGWEAVVR